MLVRKQQMPVLSLPDTMRMPVGYHVKPAHALAFGAAQTCSHSHLLVLVKAGDEPEPEDSSLKLHLMGGISILLIMTAIITFLLSVLGIRWNNWRFKGRHDRPPRPYFRCARYPRIIRMHAGRHGHFLPALSTSF